MLFFNAAGEFYAAPIDAETIAAVLAATKTDALVEEANKLSEYIDAQEVHPTNATIAFDWLTDELSTRLGREGMMDLVCAPTNW